MKKPILCFVLLLSTNFLFAQGSLTFTADPVDNNGIVDFTFDLVGGGAQYDLFVEVSFDNGATWGDIPAAYIAGGLNNVVPASGILLQWNALASFPGQVTNEAVLRVTARHVCGTDFTFTYRSSEVTYGTVLVDYGGIIGKKCWMDRNLGATQVATASNDAASYGDLFQWGRLDDGHQVRDPLSGTTAALSTTDVPGHGDFIIVPNWPNDWRSPQNDDLWQGGAEDNNPCPPGWRVPTEAELNAEPQSWSSDNNNSAGAFASPLKLPMAGYRNFGNGWLEGEGDGFYWSSTVDDMDDIYYSRTLYISIGTAHMTSYPRAYGFSVRCIKD